MRGDKWEGEFFGEAGLQVILDVIRQTFRAIFGLFGVSVADFVEPVGKEFLVLLQHQELSQKNVRLKIRRHRIVKLINQSINQPQSST